jgi:hypothetical protein
VLIHSRSFVCFNRLLAALRHSPFSSFTVNMNSTAAYQLEHPEDDQRTMIRIVTGVMVGLATLSMVLRHVSRRIKNTPMGLEDWSMIGGWVTL